MVGDVARREDAGHVRPAELVDDDAVVDPDTGSRDHLGRGLDPEPEHRQIALDAAAVLRDHALDAADPLERRHGVAQDQIDPVIAMEPLDDGADLRAERPVERGLERLDRDDLEAALAHRRRDLGADEPHADHDGAAAARDRVADAIGVGHRAQVVDTGQVEPGNREPPVAPPVAMSTLSNSRRSPPSSSSARCGASTLTTLVPSRVSMLRSR